MWGPLGNHESWSPWESEPWDLHFGGQSLLQYGPLQIGHGAGGGLDAWGQSCLRCPLLSTIITSPSLFTWVPLGIFLRLCRSRSNTHAGVSAFPWSFFASYFPPHILYSNIPSEPVANSVLKTDLAQTPGFITHDKYLELTEWEIYLLRSFLLCTFGILSSR